MERKNRKYELTGPHNEIMARTYRRNIQGTDNTHTLSAGDTLVPLRAATHLQSPCLRWRLSGVFDLTFPVSTHELQEAQVLSTPAVSGHHGLLRKYILLQVPAVALSAVHCRGTTLTPFA